jgi:nudix-type nucleoside diphosphatase (YffH/AdpP family)
MKTPRKQTASTLAEARAPRHPQAGGAPAILERQTVWAGYLTVTRLRIRLADGAEVWREVERHGDAVAVLPFDAARRCAILARLFRAPAFESDRTESLIEVCAGMIDPADADEEAAIRREAREELGLTLGPLERVARIWPSPGVSGERVTLFLAPYGPENRASAGGGVAGEEENITVVERSLSDLAADADAGRIVDGKLLTLILALRVRRPELFQGRDVAARAE